MSEATTDPTPTLLGTDVGSIAVTHEGVPDRPLVLCVHGVPGTVRDFRYLAPLLVERFCVVRIDMPGFGASPIAGTPSVAGWADLIEAVADALGVERFIVLAHSFGAAAALCLAHRSARVRGLALLASPGGRIHRAYALPGAAFRAAAALASVPILRTGVIALTRSQFARRGLETSDDWRWVRNTLRVVGSLRFESLADWASALTCPVLLAHADDDPLVEPEIAREQAARFRDCETLFWREGGHYVQKTHADAIAEALGRRFG